MFIVLSLPRSPKYTFYLLKQSAIDSFRDWRKTNFFSQNRNSSAGLISVPPRHEEFLFNQEMGETLTNLEGVCRSENGRAAQISFAASIRGLTKPSR